MAKRQHTVAIVDQVEMLDEKIARARAVREQRPDFRARDRIDLPALRQRADASIVAARHIACPAGARVVVRHVPSVSFLGAQSNALSAEMNR
jgi:hypothetical protein